MEISDHVLTGTEHTSDNASLYLHFPCFDGLVSGALTWEFLKRRGWEFTRVQPVNYNLRSTWLATKLEPPSAVIDFLYHPEAQFWADHHLTTFLTDDLKTEFNAQPKPWMFYDSAAGSCASLLWRTVSGSLDSARGRYKEMVDWAEKIDSAGYASVQEAILGDAPALRINVSMICGGGLEYCDLLLRAVLDKDLNDVAELPEVKTRFEKGRALLLAGLRRFRESARPLEGGIVAFDLDARDDDITSRYAPFYFFPEARYSIGVIRRKSGASITAMRNPWREFPSVPLGVMFERVGGGGHQRVGSVVLGKERSTEATGILWQLISEIRKQDEMKLEPGEPASA